MDIERATIQWRKSSKSGHGSNNCIEVGTSSTFEGILVRDSKDRTGPTLTFERSAWRNFLEFATSPSGDIAQDPI
ncbi:DUF397 domain-containing protein [Phytohabitans suffuscus]|uniref:DUF397 domain-containing protein n=1 Tax=Phytohabitans suffuscus TaxID=624315 RepID=A0A6F8YHA9_9ACTN|nr:DUF397 domain-containing protein [Phytohabitans suffuscus]BCB85482.1 hypothetical protein Psuf_027950 [Phytohabitans suffuscus]